MDDKESITAIMIIGMTIAVIVYKFTPLASMIQFGEAGQIIFFAGFAIVSCLATMIVFAVIKP